jgi:hypothetical protein
MDRHATFVLSVLLALYLLVNCVSLATVGYLFPDYHFGFETSQLSNAIVASLFAAGLIPLFVLARFSLGYFVGLSLYGMVAGFIWISYFSGLSYDHAQARLSASVSLLMFLLPALFVSVPMKPKTAVSPRTMDRLLVSMLICAIVVVVWNAYYGVAFVGTGEAANLRGYFVRPAILRYVTGSMVGAVLPFVFAYTALHGRYYLAGFSILLLASFYPILLTKTVLFAPAWLTFLFFMFRSFDSRVAAVLTLLVPLTAGLVTYAVASSYYPAVAGYILEVVNLRMFAIPSSAMDHYSDFFAAKPVTNFCQLSILRATTGCAYGELGTVFSDHYHLGNFNASLFATEGIASVGPVWAPVSALVCGLLFSLANGLSERLPAPLVAVSSGLVVLAILNVPLSTAALSNGLLVLFLLWLLAPDETAAIGGRHGD